MAQPPKTTTKLPTLPAGRGRAVPPPPPPDSGVSPGQGARAIRARHTILVVEDDDLPLPLLQEFQCLGANHLKFVVSHLREMATAFFQVAAVTRVSGTFIV